MRKNPSYHHGDLRSALIATSVELVNTHGADGFSMKDASKKAGVSVAAPYRHFTDKADLLCAVSLTGFSMMTERMVEATKGLESGSIECIETLGITYVRFAGEYPNLFRLMFSDLEHSSTTNIDMLDDTGGDISPRNIVKLLGLGTNHSTQDSTTTETVSKGISTEGLVCYTLLLTNIAAFLKRHNLPIELTMEAAKPLWAMVHGTAGLLIDMSFQHLADGISPETVIKNATRYFLNGLVAEKKANLTNTGTDKP